MLILFENSFDELNFFFVVFKSGVRFPLLKGFLKNVGKLVGFGLICEI
jgi:hypothetical protein